MRNIILFLLIILFDFSIYSQEVGNRKPTEESLNDQEIELLLNREFTSLFSDLPNNSIGNYATVNLEATSATLVKSFIGKQNALTFRVSGKATDGTLNLAENGKLNYDISIGAQYHFIDASKIKALVYDVSSWKIYRAKKKKIIEDAKALKRKIRTGENIKPLKEQKKKIEKQIASLDQSIKYYEKYEENIQTNGLKYEFDLTKSKLKRTNEALLEFEKDNITYQKKKKEELAKIKNCNTEDCEKRRLSLVHDREINDSRIEKPKLDSKREELKKRLESLKKLDWLEKEKELLEALKASLKELQERIDSLELEVNKAWEESFINDDRVKKLKALYKEGIRSFGSRFSWFSIGANISREKFNLINTDEEFSNQLIEENYTGYDVTLQYFWHNRNYNKKWDSYLISAGVTLRYENNLSSLSLVNFENEEVIAEGTDSRRIVRTQSKAFAGNYQKDITSALCFVDAYYFLFDGNFAALHWYPNAQFTEGLKPLWNSEIGLLFTYRDSKKEGAYINAELFYSLNDIGNRAESNLSLLSRNSVGLRLTLPFGFNYKPK